MPHFPARPRPVTPIHLAFDELKRAEDEAVRQVRAGHLFQSDNAVLRDCPRRD